MMVANGGDRLQLIMWIFLSWSVMVDDGWRGLINREGEAHLEVES